MLSKSLTKHFKSSGSGFTELHAKLDVDTLLYIKILAERPGVARAGFRAPLASKGSVNNFPGKRIGKHVA
jgi:hypothetical protein